MSFCEALISKERNQCLPKEADWFGTLIGEWDIVWVEYHNEREIKHQKGEWIFSRVLNGFGIQDLFIVPSREERIRLNQPNAEYGTTIRMYNPSTGNWEIYYTCLGEYCRLTAIKQENEIILTEKTEQKMKWIFSEITENSFHWRNIMQSEKGEWILCCDCHAIRRSNIYCK